jgi:hypothetical protein
VGPSSLKIIHEQVPELPEVQNWKQSNMDSHRSLVGFVDVEQKLRLESSPE